VSELRAYFRTLPKEITFYTLIHLPGLDCTADSTLFLQRATFRLAFAQNIHLSICICVSSMLPRARPRAVLSRVVRVILKAQLQACLYTSPPLSTLTHVPQ
jgi:hypothetical protein